MAFPILCVKAEAHAHWWYRKSGVTRVGLGLRDSGLVPLLFP